MLFHYSQENAKIHQRYNWSWCVDAKIEEYQHKFRGIWLHWFRLRWRSRWEEEYCRLHIHDWRCSNLIELKEVKHCDIVILGRWVCGCIICSLSSNMDREMLLEELKIMEPSKMKLFVDNKSVIELVMI